MTGIKVLIKAIEVAGMDICLTKRPLKPAIIETAIRLSEKLVYRELENKSNLEKSISEILNTMMDLEDVSLNISSDDAQFLEGFNNNYGIDVKVDNRLSKGEFIFESKQGYLDGRWDHRFEELNKLMLEDLEKESDDN